MICNIPPLAIRTGGPPLVPTKKTLKARRKLKALRVQNRRLLDPETIVYQLDRESKKAYPARVTKIAIPEGQTYRVNLHYLARVSADGPLLPAFHRLADRYVPEESIQMWVALHNETCPRGFTAWTGTNYPKADIVFEAPGDMTVVFRKAKVFEDFGDIEF